MTIEMAGEMIAWAIVIGFTVFCVYFEATDKTCPAKWTDACRDCPLIGKYCDTMEMED